MELKFKAVVTREASEVIEKSNGISKYVVHNCKFTEGPSEGITVGAARTLVNAEGEEKAPVKVDQEVILYGDRIIGKDGKPVYRWSISTETPEVSTEELDKLFGFVEEAEEVQLEE